MNIPRFTAGASIYKSTMPLNSARSNFAIRSHGRRRCFLFIPLALACLALSQTALAAGAFTGNTATGLLALLHNTTGVNNTATGFEALFSNTAGSYNTANGSFALFSNTTGSYNTANGYFALYSNTTGVNNTAIGFYALNSNTTGVENTATGIGALYSNTTGMYNTAYGFEALNANTAGFYNTAIGDNALHNSKTDQNTAVGFGALANNTTGYGNTAYGEEALLNNTSGTGNIALGVQAGSNLTTGSYNIDIGNYGLPGESNTIRIGAILGQQATFVAGISGTPVVGAEVFVDYKGQLGNLGSSLRFKDEIKPMDTASEAILALRPVTFRYKHEIDPNGIPRFGLVAEEVEKVNPALVARDTQGKVFSVRYEAINAMLLNEFLKEHRKVQELEAAIAQQQKEIKALAASLKEQAMQIRKARTASLK